MANTYWIRSQGVRKKPIHSCTLQRMYHSVPDPVKHLLLIVKEHLLIAALQNVAPPPKRIPQFRINFNSKYSIAGKKKSWLQEHTRTS